MENQINMLGCGWCIYLFGVMVTLVLMGYFKAKTENFNAMLWPLYFLMLTVFALYSAPIYLGKQLRKISKK